MKLESNFENKKPSARISFGVSGHEKEYIVILEDYDHRKYIPSEIEDDIQRELGENWRVDNRGTRLEIVNRKKFGLQNDEIVVIGVKKILSEHGYRFE